jgi:hypothetical protein
LGTVLALGTIIGVVGRRWIGHRCKRAHAVRLHDAGCPRIVQIVVAAPFAVIDVIFTGLRRGESFMSRHVRVAAMAAVCLGSAGMAQAELIYGLTTGNALFSFDSSSPGAIGGFIGVNGLEAGESLLGIDFRPFNGVMYGLGSNNNLYAINLSNGQANAAKVNASPFAIPLSGSAFGFDFNPTVDRIRVVSNAEQNLRLNPFTGGVVDGDAVTPGIQGDGSLNYLAGDPFFGSAPDVVGAAYTNNFNGAGSTQLFVIDALNNTLALQNPPNAGGLTTIGSLGVDANDLTGFDISGTSGIAYASLNGSLYTINLGSGAASLVGGIGSTPQILDIAVIPAPGMLGLVGLAGFLGSRRRRA